MKKLRTHFSYSWWQYLAIALVAVILWTTVYDIMAKPDANEKLTLSFFGNDYNSQALQSDLERDLTTFTRQQIEQITFDYNKAKDNTILGEMIQTRLYSADVMIFEAGIVQNEFILSSFAPLVDKMLSYFEGIDEGQFYTIDGVKYGFILTGEQIPSNNFSVYYGGGKQCVAFFAPFSQNVAGIYGNGNATDDAAISLMKYLLEYTNG